MGAGTHWKIGARLSLGFAGVLALLITASAWWQLDSATRALRSKMDEPLSKERIVSDWYRGIHTSVRRTTAAVKSSQSLSQQAERLAHAVRRFQLGA